jgi:hypothetical protein
MKHLILFTTLAIFFTACDKSSKSQPTEAHSLIGSWSLVGVDGTFLIFNSDGSVESKKWDQQLVIPYDRFQLINDSVVHFFPANSNNPVRATYNIHDHILTLQDACIYHCTEQYGRIGSL